MCIIVSIEIYKEVKLVNKQLLKLKNTSFIAMDNSEICL